MDAKQFLDYVGLNLYDILIKQFIKENDVELSDMKLTDKNRLELFYIKDDKPYKISVDLSALSTYAEWEEL